MQLTVPALILFLIVGLFADKPCKSRDYKRGSIVCVCSAIYCDTLTVPQLLSNRFLRYTSNKSGLRFDASTFNFTRPSGGAKPARLIRVDAGKQFQRILGWGGAFTDAAGLNINALPAAARGALLDAYFAPAGLGYSLGRVPIGGTDFSTRAYSYDDGEEDPELRNFALAAEDRQLKIPLLLEAARRNPRLELFASAWTAPKWMKASGSYTGGFLRHDMYQAWASYFLKFLEAYRKEGVRFWGITTGNEPIVGYLPFAKINSVAWWPTEMGQWISRNLGPTLRNSSFKDVKIVMLDDQRIFLPWVPQIVLAVENASEYVDGIGVHWYLDFISPPSLLSLTHRLFPSKFLLGTEACTGSSPGQQAVDLGSWQRGEDYANDILDDLANWVSGWVDWNLALDVQGGPTYISNFVDAPIIVNASAQEFYKQPMYYTFGHFSKFVPKNSIKIESTSYNPLRVKVAAFRRPDNSTAIIILNKKSSPVEVVVVDESHGEALLKLSPKSITTLLYQT